MIWLSRLATDRITRCGSAPAEGALVVTRPVKGALRLAAVNDAAARLGLRAGMALADARAMYPSLDVAEEDAAADRLMLEAVADWCDRYTPLVGTHVPDGVALDISGCAHLFGGEEALTRDVLARLARQGLHARLAVADTVGCAWALAHHGAAPVTLVPSGAMRDVLAPLPIAALRLAPETVTALTEAGLRRVADLLDLPRAALAARFEGLLRRLDQALGREDEPITPRLPLPSYLVEQRFAEPIALERDVLGTIERLAGRLGHRMEQRQEGARVLEAALFRTDGTVFRLTVGTGMPLRDPRRIARLFADRLARLGKACDPGFGYDLMRLSAVAAERQDAVQTGLAAPDHEAALAHLIDRLGARFGLRHITRMVAQDTHIPEFAVTAVPAHAARCAPEAARKLPPLRGRTRPGSQPCPSRKGAESNGPGEEQDTLLPARPVRLFERPEPIEAVAEVPDGPPVRFRWRRVLHEVAAAEGPERIAMEWWRDAEGRALTRDYFRIESRDGMRVWLYREGLYGAETQTPRWFLHGLFG